MGCPFGGSVRLALFRPIHALTASSSKPTRNSPSTSINGRRINSGSAIIMSSAVCASSTAGSTSPDLTRGALGLNHCATGKCAEERTQACCAPFFSEQIFRQHGVPRCGQPHLLLGVVAATGLFVEDDGGHDRDFSGRQFLQRNAGERTGRVHRLAVLVEDRTFDRTDGGALRILEIARTFGALVRVDQESRLCLVDRLARAQRFACPAIDAGFDDF